MSEAGQIVQTLLEDDYDQHVKAYRQVQKWDRAHGSYQELVGRWAERDRLFKEVGHAIALDRALAHKGVTRDEVARYLYGAAIGATDNYKGTVPAKICRDRYCELRSLGGAGNVYADSRLAKYQPVDLEKCPGCGNPLELTSKSISPSELRGKYARHIMGVELEDGHKVWFNEPIPPY